MTAIITDHGWVTLMRALDECPVSAQAALLSPKLTHWCVFHGRSTGRSLISNFTVMSGNCVTISIRAVRVDDVFEGSAV